MFVGTRVPGPSIKEGRSTLATRRDRSQERGEGKEGGKKRECREREETEHAYNETFTFKTVVGENKGST